MIQPQSDQSLPAENALRVPAAEPTAANITANTTANTTAGLRVSNMTRLDKRQYARGMSHSLVRRPSGAKGRAFPKVNLLGIEFDNVSRIELLSTLKRGVIFTPNVDHIMKLRRDRDFLLVYQTADYKVCDSQILIYVAKFLGKPLKAKLSGSDLFPWFCDYHRYNDEIKVFLLGGAAGVAREAQQRINARVGRQIVVGEYSPPYGFERDPQECEKILAMLERSPANVVAVCLGAPKQEKWIATYRDELPSIDIFMAIGATVDFEAGMKPRAPKFASELGLEWLYRLLSEPKRLWKRYLLDGFPFFALVLTEKLRQLRLVR